MRFVPPLVLLVAVSASLFAGDWPQWRGPQRNGTTPESGWLDRWDGDPPVAWRAKVGLGFSSFVVSEGRVCTAGYADGRDTVFCLDSETGKPVWTRDYPSELGAKFFEGGTTGTPTFDGDRVYWLSRWGDLFCLGASDGRVVWSRNLHEEAGVPIPNWGFSGAPLAHGDLLVLNVGDAGMGLDKATGRMVWRSANKDAGYSSPFPLRREGEWLAVMASQRSYVAVRIRDGSEVWRIHWLTQYDLNAADPNFAGDRVFLSTGYGKGAGLFDVASGTPKELWKSKVLHTQLNAAVLYKDHLYGADGDTTENAALKCVDFATGREAWSESHFGSGGVIVADGRLIALSGHGELMVAEATPDGFHPTGRGQVLGGLCWTAPVLANGRVFCRNSHGEVVVVNLRKPGV